MPCLHSCLLLLLFYTRFHNATFLVDIISPISATTEFLGSLRLTGPAIDMGVEYLGKQYSEIFRVRHKYIYDRNAASCAQQADSIEDMLSRFYYKIKSTSNATVVIFPGTVQYYISATLLNVASMNKVFSILSSR